ncbi:MAG: PhoH family protein [Zetaproteobacteria bacterium]|nr:PhoH family protein [Zetaproteobacteria bacterium]
MESRKIFVLDTNVLIHDPNALSHFDEHDVVLPMVVLEEMDKVKRGVDELARNVREVSRYLDDLSETSDDLSQGCALPGGGRLFFEMSSPMHGVLPDSLSNSNDNQIIAVTMVLKQKNPTRQVTLVSKDINLRIKARALGLVTEDYRSDHLVKDLEVLAQSMIQLDEQVWNAMGEDMEVSESAYGHCYQITWPDDRILPAINHFVLIPSERELALRCRNINQETRRVELHDMCSYRNERHAIWGVQARNLEQNMAMNLLMDADVDLVTLLGLAGSGKTLLALACGLHKTLEEGLYDRILVTRATVPMGHDIGYLPGTEKEKMEPWMGAITDNLAFLLDAGVQDVAASLGQHQIEIASLSFARGRTFTRTWVIVDEAQNLTPHQMKTLVTRMGEGSKLVVLGNNAQIDTPYLTAYSNGLSMVVERFSDWHWAGDVMLKASERSRLAAQATKVL